jgi:L-lactate dehydrogenase
MEAAVKIGIIGTGNVGCACAMAAVNRGSAREIVLVNRSRKTAEAVATDMRYGTPLGPKVDIVDGDYEPEGRGQRADHRGREQKNRQRDRSQRPAGPPQTARQERRNLSRYRAQDRAGGAQRGASRGLRSARSARRYRARGRSRGGGVEHGHISRQPALSRSPRQAFWCGSRACRSAGDWRPRTSQVFLWSSARIGGVPVAALLERRGERMGELRHKLERDVRYANITIIEGHDASQYGIGIVSARIAEMVLNDERAVIPIGSYQKRFGVTLSLPSIVGRRGVIEVLEPDMSDAEREGLRKSADALAAALDRVRKQPKAKVAASN